jgi:hypothetical protein
MGFYYISIFSLIPLAIAYGLLALVFWGLARLTRNMRGHKLLLASVGTVFLVLPIAEELWIAWNFAQVCEEAGTRILKTVRVEGFYDDTGARLDLVRSGGYRFIESRRENVFTRLTLGDADFAQRALERFAHENAGKDVRKQDVVRVKLDDRTEALLFPQKSESWRITFLDRPTARYHFRMTDPMDGTRVAYKIIRSGSVVIDQETNKEIARYTSFGRSPPWFFVGLDTPGYACDMPGTWPYTRRDRLIYREVLLPAVK